MSEWFLLAALFLFGLLAVMYLKRKTNAQAPYDLLRMSLDLQKEIQDLKGSLKEQSLDLSRQVEEQMRHNALSLQETNKEYFSTLSQLHVRLGELQSATKSMVDIGRDISSLQSILQSPKLRGGLGEFLLAELLRQILPEDHFTLQHTFKNGSKVDAVVRLGDGMIPVDAKFPLENFKRILASEDERELRPARRLFMNDVKKHIDAISQKYILPQEGTFDFALMYIPAENVYYEMMIKDDKAENICQYAWERKVIPVSPNSFYAYLSAVVRGLNGLRIERSAQIILESLGYMESEFRRFREEFDKLGSHLSHAEASRDRAERRLSVIGERFQSLSGKSKDSTDAKPPQNSPELYSN